MDYREIYYALERRWKAAPGFRFTDCSGWRRRAQTDRTRLFPLQIVVVDRMSGRRILLLQRGVALEIRHQPLNVRGFGYGETHTIPCRNTQQMAQELEMLFARMDKAA